MTNMDRDPSAVEACFLDEVLGREIENFRLFNAVAATTDVRATKFYPPESSRDFPGKLTIHHPIPFASTYETDREPALGLVLCKYEAPTADRLLECQLYGEEYFTGLTDRIVTPQLIVLDSPIAKRGKAIELLRRPRIEVTYDPRECPSHEVKNPSFAMGHPELNSEMGRACMALEQERFSELLGLLAIRLPE